MFHSPFQLMWFKSQNIVANDAEASKRAVQSAAETETGQFFDAVCGTGFFSYIGSCFVNILHLFATYITNDQLIKTSVLWMSEKFTFCMNFLEGGESCILLGYSKCWRQAIGTLNGSFIPILWDIKEAFCLRALQHIQPPPVMGCFTGPEKISIII